MLPLGDRLNCIAHVFLILTLTPQWAHLLICCAPPHTLEYTGQKAALRLWEDSCKEAGKQWAWELCSGDMAVAETLNLAKLKGARYGERKCCGLEQSGMVTVDLDQMSILTRKHSCYLLNPIVVEEICCFSHWHIPLSHLLNDSKHILMRWLARVRKSVENHGSNVIFLSSSWSYPTKKWISVLFLHRP